MLFSSSVLVLANGWLMIIMLKMLFCFLTDPPQSLPRSEFMYFGFVFHNWAATIYSF